MTDSLKVTDDESAAIATAPRVALADIEAAIIARYEFSAINACKHVNSKVLVQSGLYPRVMDSLQVLSICLLVLRNGFTVIGKSAPASPENFDADLGHKFAYQDAVRQCWPLLGFALRDRLSRDRDDDQEAYKS